MLRIRRKKSSYIKFLELLNNPDLSKNDLILYFDLVELLGTDNKGKFKKNFLIESNEVLANALDFPIHNFREYLLNLIKNGLAYRDKRDRLCLNLYYVSELK